MHTVPKTHHFYPACPVKPEICLTGVKLFSVSPGPSFPPERRPSKSEANRSETPKLYICQKDNFQS
jgi:hypothetical protein